MLKIQDGAQNGRQNIFVCTKIGYRYIKPTLKIVNIQNNQSETALSNASERFTFKLFWPETIFEVGKENKKHLKIIFPKANSFNTINNAEHSTWYIVRKCLGADIITYLQS